MLELSLGGQALLSMAVDPLPLSVEPSVLISVWYNISVKTRASGEAAQAPNPRVMAQVGKG